MRLTDVDQLFVPENVAVFGASDREGSVGGMVYRNLVAGGCKGSCYPINPKHETVAGNRCYKNLAELKRTVDLALIITPAETVPGILDQCGGANVKAAVVLSAGFGEHGERGATLQERLVEAARRNRIRVLGPNCLGVMRPSYGLNASCMSTLPAPGKVALVSQSGAICTAMLDWAAPRQVGFSAVVSLGAAADVDFGDVLDYLALDPQTNCILLYVEGIRDARRFMSGLRAAARLKPVIVIKSGRHAAGSRAAKSHTGAYVGASEVFRAAMERGGGVRVDRLWQLFAAAQVFGAGRRMLGNRIAIITNGGGPGVIAVDRAVERCLVLARFSDETRAALEQGLPDHWSHGNPIDVIGDASAERYRIAIDAALADKGVDGVLVVFSSDGRLAVDRRCRAGDRSGEADPQTGADLLDGRGQCRRGATAVGEERRAASGFTRSRGGRHVLPVGASTQSEATDPVAGADLDADHAGCGWRAADYRRRHGRWP